ncbi:hypothetical protein METH_17545 [Leisingera methylohalidivorans DSM 14336]|uniref:Uncharacterized protein n=1 Tax=Leisingera methylohalidivorans DSM 14336 TaxID=999552 RepID=V9VZP6_9RHOB|nr:hypothetical protein METH_17545 [Leisingera methylohalidivorans DSM 14336]
MSDVPPGAQALKLAAIVGILKEDNAAFFLGTGCFLRGFKIAENLRFDLFFSQNRRAGAEVD